jgi:serine/threonine-protein kinase RsbW
LTTPEALQHVAFAPGRLDVGAAIDWIAAVAAELGATERQAFAAKLCAEELLANVLRHDAVTPDVTLTLAHADKRLALTIEDGGAPFDPTKGPQREALGDLDAARPGGWGLALIRRFADDFSYRRSSTHNLVSLSFLP